jgi:hypothetical protein
MATAPTGYSAALQGLTARRITVIRRRLFTWRAATLSVDPRQQRKSLEA